MGLATVTGNVTVSLQAESLELSPREEANMSTLDKAVDEVISGWGLRGCNTGVILTPLVPSLCSMAIEGTHHVLPGLRLRAAKLAETSGHELSKPFPLQLFLSDTPATVMKR